MTIDNLIIELEDKIKKWEEGNCKPLEMLLDGWSTDLFSEYYHLKTIFVNHHFTSIPIFERHTYASTLLETLKFTKTLA